MKPLSFKWNRVAIVAALFFFSHTALEFSAKAETYKDIIEKAQVLASQKERSQAITLLNSAIKKENKKNSGASRELYQSIEDISSLFYSDKAQQLYELALSLYSTDSNLALAKLAEASKLENDNLTILIETARISSGADCAMISKQFQKLQETNPYSELVQLALLQAAVCNGEFDKYVQLKTFPIEAKSEALQIFWLDAEIEYLLKQNQTRKAKDILNQMQKLSKNYPSLWYWTWKLESDSKQKADKSGPKYISSCKSISTREERQFRINPMVCRRVAEVESYLKKLGSGEEMENK